MQGPGQSLRQAREAGGKTIEEMSEATGIRLPFLTALEHEAYDSLPGRGFGKLYIRAYAEVLGFDPRPVIEAYDHAVPAPAPDPDGTSRPAIAARWRPERPAERIEDEPLEEPETVEEPEPARPVRLRWWPGAALLLVAVPLLAYFVFSRAAPNPPPVAARKSVAPPPSPPVPAPPQAELPPVREPAASLPALQVAESGIEGGREHFVAGQRVTFETRVLGGARGGHIRHVWLRDGKVEQSILLRLGGGNWHTFSTKTLGRPGAWSVEARDEEGHVLARADLTVAP